MESSAFVACAVGFPWYDLGRAVRIRRFVWLAALLAGQAAPPLPVLAQTTGFIVRLGNDTLAVERTTRTATGMEGELLRRVPSSHLIRYTVAMGNDGVPSEFRFSIERPGATAMPGAVRAGRIAFGRDSARVELERDTVHVQLMPVAQGFPALPDSYGLFELWLAFARRSGADTVSVSAVAPLGGPAGRLRLRSAAADTVLVPWAGGTLRLRVAPTGDLLAVDTWDTAVKDEVDRVAPMDLQALLENFVAAEARNGAMGTWISPRDTVVANVAGAQLWFDYGRPAARGREVFGQGVLGDTLWRTGANAATQFRTDVDLRIGGAHVPAGTYTLWTHYVQGRASLVINTQTGQWGTQYDRERDLVRVPLRVQESSDPPAELFTIEVRPVPNSTGAELLLRWSRTILAVDVEPG